MKPILKINFTDFWQGFLKDNNYFYNVLSTQYNVILDEKPDYLFYSSYGNAYLNYKCIRIYHAAENIRPDFSACDYAFSFDFSSNKRNFRFPLYGSYIDVYPNQLNEDVSNLFRKRSREELEKVWQQKKKFCCIVVSNPASSKRIDFFKKLNAVKKVDSGGRYLNNIGEAVKYKLEFIKDYRFVISFENASYPGYTTEKILEPIIADCIPIYWGNPLINLDFNKDRFINYSTFENEDALIKKIFELENNPGQAVGMLMNPAFPGGVEKPVYIRDNEVLSFFNSIVQQKEFFTPVAQSYKRYFHWFKRKMLHARSYAKAVRAKLKF